MTSFGRGRGWSNHQSQDKDQGLRRPGGSASSNNKILKDIIDKIVSYDECESVSPKLIQDIVDLLTIAINEDSLRYYEFSFGKDAFHLVTQIDTSVILSLAVFLLEDTGAFYLYSFLTRLTWFNLSFSNSYN